MRKTLAVVALTTALTGGTAALTAPAYAAPVTTGAVAAEQSTTDNDAPESDKTGLWGLLGLLGLAGLAKRKEHTETRTGTARR